MGCTLWTVAIAVPTAYKHLYGIGRYDPVKIVFLGALGVLSEAGGKYVFALEKISIFFEFIKICSLN
jgi:hypothetical protein